MTILRFFKSPAFNESKTEEVLRKLKNRRSFVERVSVEICYHVETNRELQSFSQEELEKLKWLLSHPFRSRQVHAETSFSNLKENQRIIECGPRFNFSTADSSNAVQICDSMNLQGILRLETSHRYLITTASVKIDTESIEDLSSVLYDRMTHCVYTSENLPRNTFNESLNNNPEPWFYVPLMEEGKKALQDVNKKLGLAFDDWDIDFYADMFLRKLKRNPTSVECFDLAQSNSEHSRHWFFKGDLFIDGKNYDRSLIEMIMDTQKNSNANNVIKFSDNSSAIEGFVHDKLIASNVSGPGKIITDKIKSDIIFTAETHNMPTAISPFSGATTGTGGRIRDVQAVGRGGHCVAGTAGYCVGNLNLPNFKLPWEDNTWEYPYNFASPSDILIEASNGASDYGNKFGEPVITGFVISYGLKNAENIREEYVKPVMFSGGIGHMPHNMIDKIKPEKDMLVVKLGGPVYRIGVGGGAASSVAVQGDDERSAALDFGAVQRGDPEMGNRLNRIIRMCLETAKNPILAIHDQGAGGNGNVLKELVEPKGAVIFTKQFQLGDPTITTMELWGAEYQENNAILCMKTDKKLLEDICARERCPVSFVGTVTDDGHVKLVEDSIENSEKYKSSKGKSLPFDLSLEAVLGKMPRKVFNLSTKHNKTVPLTLPPTLNVLEALSRVFKLTSVGSKRYLTNKVDRCVTGLIAQQQCVGPLHTPLADYGMIALSYSDVVGAATSIGTQPIKGIINPEVGARMAVGEALTNLVFAGITCLEDVKCSGNWMWSGKTGVEGGRLAMACRAMCEIMAELGIAVDGGKDSLSMSAGVKGTRVQSPGTLVISTYAPCPDITVKLQPYLKMNNSVLLWVPVTPGKYRLGGTALAHCYQQQGNESPDVDCADILKKIFNTTQVLIKEGKLLSGHDISDGGFITCILEMAFAGLRGVHIEFDIPNVGCMEALFNEELGLVLEIDPINVDYCTKTFEGNGIRCHRIGHTQGMGMTAPVTFVYNGVKVLESKLVKLFRLWEEVSYKLELCQANAKCVEEEWQNFENRTGPKYTVNFSSENILLKSSLDIKVAVIREEGTNGDREMIASLMKSNFQVYDVTMSDLIAKTVTLDRFNGVVFPGGFSYADTLGSAKGWAGSILFDDYIFAQFDNFAHVRKDTFSLGVCNGCQLMPWIGWTEADADRSGTPRIALDRNDSGRFECRWSCVSIRPGRGTEVWFRGMEGSTLGVWIAHGEGKFSFKEPEALEELKRDGRICVQYVDDGGNPTEEYPMNPNGSPLGIAGVCSKDGRHLSMMPHPERCTLSWQCAYDMESRDLHSPWQRMFDNAHAWAAKRIGAQS